MDRHLAASLDRWLTTDPRDGEERECECDEDECVCDD